MEIIQSRGRNLILPVSGENSTLTRGAILPARYLHEPQPTSYYQSAIAVRVSHRAGPYHTARGRINPEDLRLRLWFAGVVEMWKGF